MYKINTHSISGVRNYVNNPDCTVVMVSYVYIANKIKKNSCLVTDVVVACLLLYPLFHTDAVAIFLFIC